MIEIPQLDESVTCVKLTILTTTEGAGILNHSIVCKHCQWK